MYIVIALTIGIPSLIILFWALWVKNRQDRIQKSQTFDRKEVERKRAKQDARRTHKAWRKR